MRVIFAGTPAVAVPSLSALLAADSHEVVSVLTRPDAPFGRKRVLTPSPVASAADDAGVEVVKSDVFDDRTVSKLRAADADLGVVVAYGGLIPDEVLAIPRLGWVNLHFSLLPNWRGAAPVQRAIMAGDRLSGVSVFQLVKELDAGAVFAELSVPIDPDVTASALLEELSFIGAEVLLNVVNDLESGTAVASEQQGDVSYAKKLSSADGMLRLSEPAARVYDQFRGVTSEPGAAVSFAGQRLKILDARVDVDLFSLAPGELALIDRQLFLGTAAGALQLLEVQPFAKKAMKAVDWWRGLRLDSAFVDVDLNEAM